jgi:ABC-type transport system involved in multi-copper enzyme maturation permease subunit
MMRRIWNAYMVELIKASRLRVTLAGPVLVVASVCATALRIPIARDGLSDYRFVFEATTLSLDLLGLLLIVIFCTGLISSEMSRGTIRLVLVRPLRRFEFLCAKFLLGTTFALLLLVLAGATSWGLVLAFGEAHGVEYGGETIYTGAGMAGAYAAAAAFNALPLLAVVAYALLISTLNRSSVAAIGWSVGIWLLVDMIKYPLNIAPFIFSTYLEGPWQTFARRCDGFKEVGLLPDASYWILAVSLLWTIALVAAAAGILQRRSLHG